MNGNSAVSPSRDKWFLLFVAWFSILLISDLPDLCSKTLFGSVPDWIFYCKMGIIGLFAGLCLVWKRLNPLRPYAFVMFIFMVALTLSEQIRTASWWAGLIPADQGSFFLAYLRPFIRDIGVTLLVLAALWIIKRKRSEFFLVKGDLRAPIEPVRWLGIRSGESWRTFGWIFALAAGFGVAFPTILGLRPSSAQLLQIVPLIPSILFFSAINAFNEELYFRATLLSTLPQIIGKSQALLLNAVFFGLAHYLNGSPPGMVGFLMTGFLAWLLGKSMLETKGFVWPWFIHFIPDVVIFASYAILWFRP